MQIACKDYGVINPLHKNMINSTRLLSYYYQLRSAQLRKWRSFLRKREGNKFGTRSTFREVNNRHKRVTQHSMRIREPREVGLRRQTRDSGRGAEHHVLIQDVPLRDCPCD